MSKRMIDSELIEALGTDIKFDGTGNVTVGKNLEVGGKLRLKGEFANVRTYEFTDNTGTKWILEDYGAISTAWDYHIIGLSDEPGNYLVFGLGFYQVNEQGVNGVDVLGMEYYSTAYQEFSYYDGVMTIRTAAYEENTQPKLYRHVLNLSNSSFMYSGYIVYISTSNLKVASLEDLTTLLKPSKNYIYPLTGTCTGLDTRDAIQFGSKNLYIKSFDKISYENNVWYFKDNYGDTETFDTVSDTVTPL